MLLAPQNLSQLTLNPPASFPELYQELWWYSGATVSTTSALLGSFVQKGSTSVTSSNTGSQVKLFTLSSSWPSGTKVALELTLWGANASNNALAQLYDITSSSLVGSQISVATTTATVVRSTQFTLTPGHTYALCIGTGNASYATYMTDASLIIFPPAGSVSPSLSSISLSNPSGGSLKEAYIPLWVYSSGVANTANTSSGGFLGKGTVSVQTATASSAKLYNLSTGWSPSQKFAFEASIYNSSSGGTSVAQLWDMTSNTAVSGASVSVTGNTATLIRSGQFTLTPGHSYGVTFYSQTSSQSADITKAHLVAIGG